MQKVKIKNNKSFGIKVFVVLLAFLAMWVANSYVKGEIADRAIVLGIGIDYADGIFEVTTEVVSPGESSESGGGSTSKLLSGKGETVPLAIQEVFQTSGKNPSLGQTGIILLGEGMYSQELKHILSYFVLSDAFKDGVTLASCKGSAKKIFESTSPVDNMVSFALQTIIQKSGKKTNGTTNVLQNFVDDQTQCSLSSYLSEVNFVDDGNDKVNKDKNTQKKTGVYDCSRVSVFKNGRYVDTLSADETRGFVMIDASKTYDSFVVDAKSIIGTKDRVSVGITSKSVDKQVEFKDDKIVATYNIKMSLRRMRTDINGNVMDLLPKVPTRIDQNIKDQVQTQVMELVVQSCDKSKKLNCDFLGVANNMFKKYGKKWQEFQTGNADYMQNVVFDVKVEVTD